MNRTCFNCGKNLKNNENSHIRSCNKTMLYKDARYKQLIHDFKDLDLTEQNILNLYLVEENSMLDIKNNYGLAYRQIYFLFEYYGIEKRDKNSVKRIKMEKYRNTCISKYGKENSTTEETLDKIKKSCLDKFGVDNIFKDTKFIKNSISRKREKYGKAGLGWLYESEDSKRQRVKTLHDNLRIWWREMDGSEKENRILMLKDNRFKWWSGLSEDDKYEFISNLKDNYESSIEGKVKKILDLNNIKYKSQYWIDRKSYDLLVGDKILEINGDFWHCNPNKYKSSYIHPYLKLTADEIWSLDLVKKEIAEDHGFKVFYIWEDFIKKNDDYEILQYIQHILKL